MSVLQSTIVGALACQRNSFLKSFQTRVVSCKEYEPIMTSKDKQNKNAKKEITKPQETLFAVELEDTILFPEGGGQPFDTGSIVSDLKEVDVKQVVRDKLTAVHVVSEPMQEGAEVTLKLDWNRRFDIMQQHTGQHLLSAVFDTYDLDTLSWSMGETINYIELPRKVEKEVVDEVSRKVNDLISQNVPIKVTTPDEHGGEIDASKIPDDYDLSKGIVRVVKIGDIDANPCCGTHLTSTGQIQAIALLHQANIRGGNSRLHFACGSRVTKLTENYHNVLKDAGSTLSCQVEEVASKAVELTTNYKAALSRENNLLKELATLQAKSLFEEFKQGGAVTYAYRDDNSAYMQLLQKELLTLINLNKEAGVNLSDRNTIVFINGDYKSGLGGQVKIMGPQAPEILDQIKSLVTNLKGGGKGASFQAKVTKYEKGEVEQLLKYLELMKI